MPEDVQPAPAEQPEQGGEGQGVDGSTGGLYDLASVPEDLRQFVEPHLKAMEGNVTKRFQEYASERDAWKPYDELGLRDVDPAQLQQLLQFAELAQDEDAFADWWRSVGERLELFEEAGSADDLDNEDLYAEDLTPDQIKALVAEAVTEQMQPLAERFDSTEQERIEQESLSEIQEQLAEIKGEYGDDTDTDAILKLAYAYAEEDPENAIDRGLEDYLSLTGKGAADLFADKAGQPPSPEGRGAADTRPEPITNFADAKEAATARLRAANTA